MLNPVNYYPGMRMSDGVEWSIHSCVLLAVLPPDRSLPSAKLAEFHGVPAAYLAKHLQAMAHAGIVRAVAGRRGGYRLARTAAEVTLLDVVDAVEGGQPAFRCTEIRARGPVRGARGDYRQPCGVAAAMWQAGGRMASVARSSNDRRPPGRSRCVGQRGLDSSGHRMAVGGDAMKVFVAGGTGAIGRFAVPALVAAGHDLTVVARDDAKASEVEAMGATPVQTSLFDPVALAAAVAGHEVVVNLATAIPTSVLAMAQPSAWKENDRIRTDGVANLVDAALAAGATRFVQESIAFTYPDRGDEWIDEDTPLEPVEFTRSILVAETSARRFAQAGPDNHAVVLRFGGFYGPGSGHTDAMLAAARRHLGPTLGPAHHWVAPLHLASGGDAVVAALKAPSGTYNVAEEPVTWRQYAEALGRAVGEAPWLRVPGRLAELFGDRGGPLHRSQRVSSRRFRQATGWTPRYATVTDGWPAVVAAIDRSVSVGG